MKSILFVPLLIVAINGSSGSRDDDWSPSRNSMASIPDDALPIVVRYLGSKSKGEFAECSHSNAKIVEKVRTEDFPGGLDQIKIEFQDLVDRTGVTAAHIRNSFQFNTKPMIGFIDPVNYIYDSPFVLSRGNYEIQGERASYLAVKVHGENFSPRSKMNAYTFKDGILTEIHYFDGALWHNQHINQNDQKMQSHYLLGIQNLIEGRYDLVRILGHGPPDVMREDIPFLEKAFLTLTRFRRFTYMLVAFWCYYSGLIGFGNAVLFQVGFTGVTLLEMMYSDYVK